ncbi:hypothetical protein CKF94_01355 [Vibrio coralliilyticus]|uniref:hypothetical protein n=1 Tax=Vibrio coralliilyticus TaxID=190893 RepID=UPI000BAA99B3|nr:hypothetical protein [Vibrio coralliilyticus]PAU39732.1 hypothetical protein CKF94_01355 [Vibrio coralliilyticus]
MQDIIFTYVIPIMGLLLGVFGVFDKIVFGIGYISRRQNERRLRLAQCDLEDLNRFNSSISCFVAFQFKQLFRVVSIVLFAVVLNSYPLDRSIWQGAILVNISLFLMWLGGFFTGKAFRAVNYVLQREALEVRINSRISQYSELLDSAR